MALSGSFEDISFAELLQLLNVSHKSGRLHVARGAEQADLGIYNGNVVRALSRLERGPEVVYRILGWQTGEFTFERSDDPMVHEISEPTEALILEGMKRLDEWERVESEMPEMHTVLRQRVAAVNEHFDELSPAAQKALRLVDARRNVATIIRESGLEPLEALNAVTELVAAAVVEEWTQPAETTVDVLRAKDHLPEAKGGIDFSSSGFFSAKRSGTEREAALATPKGGEHGDA